MKHTNLLKMAFLILFFSYRTLFTFATENAPVELGCSYLLTPQNQSVFVNISSDLTWQAVVGATGYILRVGTSSGGGEILDNIDVGNVTTYDPGDFPCGSTIFVKITPYDGFSTPPLCNEEVFETEYVIADAGWDTYMCLGSSALLIASGGIYYQWEPPETLDDPYVYNPIATPLETTVYWVTVTNASGCWDTDYTTVYVNSNPFPNVTKTDLTCFWCNDGTAMANPIYGTPPYNYLWNTGATTQGIEGLWAGDYIVTVTDDLGCFGVEEVTINQFDCPEMDIEYNWKHACYGQCDGYISISNVINGEPPFTYLWSNGETTPSIYSLCPDNYVVTVTDANNCPFSYSFYLGEYTEIIPYASSTEESCFGCNDGTATVNPEGGIPPYWYHWSTDEYTQSISNLAPGIYTVTVGDSKECFSVEVVDIPAFVCPELDIDEYKNNACFELCNGFISISGIINGVAPFTYAWSNGETTSSIYSLCPGNYYVNVMDSKNCTVFEQYDILEYPQIVANESSSDESCFGCNNGTATVNPTGGTPGYWYQWSTGEYTQTITGLAPGLYTVTVGDPNECSTVATVTINPFECPEMEIQENRIDVSCFGECDGYIAITSVTNSMGTLMYSWSDGSNGSELTGLCPGNYTVTITDVSINCSVSESYTITEPTQFLSTFSATDETCNGCNDGTANVYPSGGTPDYWYQWSNGELTQNVTGLAPGTYTVTVGDAHECTTVLSISINPYGCPEMVIEDNLLDISCFGECDGYISISSVSNTIGTLMYSWSNGSNGSELTGLCAGNYSVTVTDLTNNCSVSKSYTITEPTQFLSAFSATDETCNGCNDGTATVNPSGGTPDYWYQWSNGEFTQTVSNLSPGTYTVTVGDAHECTRVLSITINPYGCPEMVIEDNLLDISCFGECDGYISIISVSNAIGTLMYSWNDGASGSELTGLCAGNYSVTITDLTNNCSVSKLYTLTDPEDILIVIDEKVNPTESAQGKISISSNNDGTYTFTWTGPDGYTADTEDIDSLDQGCYHLIVANANDCSKDTTICIEKETGFFEIANSLYIKMYPNPANDIVFLDFTESSIQRGIVEIFDISGQSVVTTHIADSISHIDLLTIKQGLYLVKFINDENLFYKRLIVNK